MPNYCTAAEIFLLHETKEYTLTATFLLEHLLSNSNLCGQSSKLWQFLFNKVRFDKELAITISYAALAKHLQKSTRTIIRYAKNLQQEGYLLIEKHYSPATGQTANTLKVRAPQSVMKQAFQQKNRFIKKDYTQMDTTITFSHKFISPDNFVTPPYDKIVTQNITKPKENNNNRTVVASLYKKESTTSSEDILVNKKDLELEHQIRKKEIFIQKLEQEKTILEQTWIAEVTAEKKYQAFREYNQACSMLEIEKFRLEDLKKNYSKLQQQQIKTEAITEDPFYVMKRAGERPISQLSHLRMMKTLQNLGFQGSLLNQMANEITFEIRFGSLVKAQNQIENNTVERALNIALKLIREHRWQKPQRLQCFIDDEERQKVSNG